MLLRLTTEPNKTLSWLQHDTSRRAKTVSAVRFAACAVNSETTATGVIAWAKNAFSGGLSCAERQRRGRQKRSIDDLESKLDKLLTTISNPESKILDTCLEQESTIVSFRQASALVAHFQDLMAPHFPFLVFSLGTLLDEIRQTGPLLLLTILAAAAYDNPARQKVFVQKVQTAINNKLHSDAMLTVKVLQAFLFDRQSDSKLPPPVWSDFRIQALLDGLRVSNQMATYLKGIDPQIQRASNQTEWLQIGYFIVVSCKLVVASCEPPVFGLTQYLREELNMPMLLELTVGRMKSMTDDSVQQQQQGHEDDSFSYMVWLKPIQDWFNWHYAPDEPVHNLIVPSDASRFNMEADGDYLASGNWYDFQWTNFLSWPAEDRSNEWV
ncbi:hypothetical protein PISL3812_05285 [Talaromyces islandicus]|uniref:Uncharacterized protein n=1 Tax=Talaromyces islandicus TaxID=28573 RepID=A0A0U1LY31_TALIS|nr:hypothetical protein PISL3812_05285 [Talaromyces islandicus]